MALGTPLEERERAIGPPLGGGRRRLGTSFRPLEKRERISLRDWEFTLATGKDQRTEEVDEGPWGGWGLQEEVSPAVRANIYAGIRTVGEVLPYTRFLFPSGRDEWAGKTTLGQTIELGIEALSILPFAAIGKGLRVVKRIGRGVKNLPLQRGRRKFPLKKEGEVLEQAPFLDSTIEGIRPYDRSSAAEKAMKKWNLSTEEADRLLAGEPFVWARGGRGGAFFTDKGSKGFQKLFREDGFVKTDVKKQLERWSRPHETQELRHYMVEWNKLVKSTFGQRYKVNDLFRMQAVKIYGKEGKKLKIGDIDTRMMKRFIQDMVDANPAKFVAEMDVGYGHWMPYWTVPARKIFGLSDRVWGTLKGVYDPVKRMFSNSNSYATLLTSKWHSILASRGLGKLLAKKEAGVIGLKKSYSKREWEAAGELVTRMDEATAQGLEAEVIQGMMSTASENVQKLAKSWFDFSDHLYADYMKKKIPRVFREIGLTKKGEDGLSVLMGGPNGISRYLDVGFSQSANMAHKNLKLPLDKARLAGAMLKKSREMLTSKNLGWFIEPGRNYTKKELADVVKRIAAAKKELTFMKKGGRTGFVNYLDNYAMRIYGKQLAQSTERTIALSRKAGFTKARTRPLAPERTTDLARIIERRINSQAKELYVYKQLEPVIEGARKLPEKLRDYSEHWIARQLGEASGADMALAQWLSGTAGRVTGKIYDERSVMQLAHTINDLVYMGGLGFKPFSAMRNYFQPLLMVPADMGGIKDFYWLGKGYAGAFKRGNREFIQSIGAIQEFAPDLYLRPRVAGFGKTVVVKGKKVDLPSTQRMRDLALWMFKNSDRHNRYVTGSAAITKWDHFATKYLSKGIGKKEVSQFTKKLNLGSRDEWIRAQINEHLRRGTAEGVLEAKKAWVYDVIADTQYLYGTLDAPIYGQKYGSLGKMAGIFQSWWMNYGSALEKWALRTPGTIPIVNKRMMTWFLAGAIVEESASNLWPRSTVRKMVHEGPFPITVSEFQIPPSFAPVYFSAKTLAAGIEAIKYQEPEKFTRALKVLLRSTTIMIPGGLQMMQFQRGFQKEGWKGLLKAIVRYDPTREED